MQQDVSVLAPAQAGAVRSIAESEAVVAAACALDAATLAARAAEGRGPDRTQLSLPALAGTPGQRAALICAAVAAKHGVSVDDLFKRTRAWRISHARFEAMARLQRLLDWSLNHIGDYFDGFDHTSVMYAIARAEELGLIAPKAATAQ